MDPCLEEALEAHEAGADCSNRHNVAAAQDNRMECCSDDHSLDNHCLEVVVHNHLLAVLDDREDLPFSSHNNHQEEAGYLAAHHSEAYDLEVHLCCYTSCWVAVPLDNFLVEALEALQQWAGLAGHRCLGQWEALVSVAEVPVQPTPSLTDLKEEQPVDCRLEAVEASAVGH